MLEPFQLAHFLLPRRRPQDRRLDRSVSFAASVEARQGVQNLQQGSIVRKMRKKTILVLKLAMVKPMQSKTIATRKNEKEDMNA